MVKITKSEYGEYLKSDHWKKIREERKKIDHYKCQLCGCSYVPDLDVHHIKYDNLGYENVEFDVVTVCTKCHKIIHEVIDNAVPQLDHAYGAYQDWCTEYLVSSEKLEKLNFRYVDQVEKIIANCSEPLNKRTKTGSQQATMSKLITEGLKTWGKKDYSDVSIQFGVRSTKKFRTLYLYHYVQQGLSKLKRKR